MACILELGRKSTSRTEREWGWTDCFYALASRCLARFCFCEITGAKTGNRRFSVELFRGTSTNRCLRPGVVSYI